MAHRIDLFLPPRSQYRVLHHFTYKLGEALKRANVDSRILEAEYHNPKPFLEALFQDRPDCTLSFNGLLPDNEGRFFCDMIQIPHVSCLVDSPNQFLQLAHSPLTIITCADRFSCDFFRGLGCKNVLFMPHAVEKDLPPPSGEERIYDVVVLNSLIDYELIQSEWKDRYDKPVREAMNQAIKIVMSDEDTHYVQAFVDSLDLMMELHGRIDPKDIDFVSVLDDIEMYIKGKSRIDIIKSVKDVPVHVFGAAASTASWEKYLGNDCPNVVIHEPVPFEQAVDIMKQSKIVLNNCPWIKNGAHERIFYGLACGALVITNDNIYMRENFKNDQNIVLFKNSKLEEVNDKVNEYLSHPEKLKKVVAAGRDLVMREHTWDNRAQTLVKELGPILKEIQSGVSS
jgi:spore maturation protein CgeB